MSLNSKLFSSGDPLLRRFGRASGGSLEPAVGYMRVAASMGEPRGILWGQLSGIRVLLHAWACLRRFSGPSCRVYVCCCMPGQASGDSLKPAVGYTCAAARASGDSLGPAVGYTVLLHAWAAWAGLRRFSGASCRVYVLRVLLHAWASLRGLSGASCRVYVCCCMPGLACWPQGILWGQLSGIGPSIGEPAVGYRCLGRMMWKEGEDDDVEGEEDDEEDGKVVGRLA